MNSITIEKKPAAVRLQSPWETARNIADWLPDVDRARALRIIAAHERLHARAERDEMIEGAD